MTVPAFAKVNLTLRVLGRRPDGFHALCSIVAPLELHDDVTVTVRPGGRGDGAPPQISVETIADGVDCSALGEPEGNLAVRAARAFLARLAPGAPLLRAGGLEIRIVKRIPLGAGLGGGSADAAATLLALRSLCGGGGLDAVALRAAAAETGSDVTVLLEDGPVLMEGRGEEVTPLAGDLFAPMHVLLANPGIHVDTAAAFAEYDRMAAGKGMPAAGAPPPDAPPGPFRTVGDYAALLANDLEGPVAAMHGGIAATAATLKGAGGAAVLMAGSGSTVFAIAASRAEAVGLAGALPPGTWWRVTRMRAGKGVQPRTSPAT